MHARTRLAPVAPALPYDCVRPGVALYGLHPSGDEGEPTDEGLRPAMVLKSYVADVRRLEAGDGVSYGVDLQGRLDDVRCDGAGRLRRGVPAGALGAGRGPHPGRAQAALGRVTMDACVLEVDGSVEVGDEVVLLGEQAGERVTAEEIGAWAGTINYEVTTGVNPSARREEL